MDVFEPAADFNRRIIGIERPTTPTPLSKERRKAIADHLREEAQELEDADELADQMDALTDLIFIAAGRFYETGTDGPAHYTETSRANRSRVRGNNAKRPNSFGFDAVKPEGWQEPNHERILRSQISSVGHIEAMRPPVALLSPPKRPKVILLGHARHGKDTVAEIMRDQYGFAFNSSSMFCAEHVVRPAMAKEGIIYPDLEACYADRVNHRARWFDLIRAYNVPDASRLCREMFEAGNDIYVGMRSAEEFAVARHLADRVVWVDASGRGLPPEPEDSFNIHYSPFSMLRVNNDGTLKDLERAVSSLMQFVL